MSKVMLNLNEAPDIAGPDHDAAHGLLNKGFQAGEKLFEVRYRLALGDFLRALVQDPDSVPMVTPATDGIEPIGVHLYQVTEKDKVSFPFFGFFRVILFVIDGYVRLKQLEIYIRKVVRHVHDILSLVVDRPGQAKKEKVGGTNVPPMTKEGEGRGDGSPPGARRRGGKQKRSAGHGGAYTAQESDLMHTRTTQRKRQAHALFFLPSCGNGRNVV